MRGRWAADMNALIKDLYMQAHEDQPPVKGEGSLTKDILWSQPKKFNPEKYAELIVEACAALIENTRMMTAQESYDDVFVARYDALEESAKKIREHFGVKQ